MERSRVVEFDSGGSEGDSATYGGDNYDRFQAITITDDGCLLAGETMRSGEDQTDGWAMQAADPIAGAPDQ